jgi:hypothetical protein
MLLKKFVARDGMLRVYKKGKSPRASTPEKECAERDYFEFEYRRIKTNNKYENWLSQIEGNGAAMLDSIIQRRAITHREDAEIWAVFVASLFGRTRKVRAHVSEAMAQKFRQQVDNSDSIRDLQLSLLKQGELHYADDIRRAVTAIYTTMESSPSYFFVSALPNRVRMIAADLMTRDWHTIDAAEGCNFLLSDCPVITYEVRNGKPCPGTGFGNQATIVLLPVSPKHLFAASPHRVMWPTVFPPIAMASVNRLIVNFAHRNVYANGESEEVQKLVDAEINTIDFGKNAFVPPAR